MTAISPITIELTKRKVNKVVGGYQVVEVWYPYETIVKASKVYAHSTSAFAALGRLTQKDVEAQTNGQ